MRRFLYFVALVVVGVITTLITVSLLLAVSDAAYAHDDDCETISTVHDDDGCETSTPTPTPTITPTVEPTLPVEPTATPDPCGDGLCVPVEPTCAPDEELQPSGDSSYVCGPADQAQLPETGTNGALTVLVAAALILWGVVFVLGSSIRRVNRWR